MRRLIVPNMPNHTPKKKTFSIYQLFLILAGIILLLNSVDLTKATLQTVEKRKKTPFYFSGFQFLKLQEVFHGVPYAGYYTDKDLSNKQNAAQFSQAQYILAPTVLELNNLNRELIIFDCTSEKKAVDKIKEIGAVPLKKNPNGLILAQKLK